MMFHKGYMGDTRDFYLPSFVPSTNYLLKDNEKPFHVVHIATWWCLSLWRENVSLIGTCAMPCVCQRKQLKVLVGIQPQRNRILSYFPAQNGSSCSTCPVRHATLFFTLGADYSQSEPLSHYADVHRKHAVFHDLWVASTFVHIVYYDLMWEYRVSRKFALMQLMDAWQCFQKFYHSVRSSKYNHPWLDKKNITISMA